MALCYLFSTKNLPSQSAILAAVSQLNQEPRLYAFSCNLPMYMATCFTPMLAWAALFLSAQAPLNIQRSGLISFEMELGDLSIANHVLLLS